MSINTVNATAEISYEEQSLAQWQRAGQRAVALALAVGGTLGINMGIAHAEEAGQPNSVTATTTSALIHVEAACSFEAIGHRGTEVGVPKNSMAAYEKAAEQGANGIEMDVQFSKNGTPYIFHDDTLNDQTNGRGSIGSKTDTQLDKLRLDVHGREHIPKLAEVAQWAGSHTTGSLSVEYKARHNLNDHKILRVTNILKKYGVDNRTILNVRQQQSKNMYRVVALQRKGKISKQLTPALIIRDRQSASNLRKHGIKLAFTSEERSTSSYIKSLHKNGILAYAWTPNRKGMWQKFRDRHADGIVTDKVGRMVRWCDPRQKKREHIMISNYNAATHSN